MNFSTQYWLVTNKNVWKLRTQPAITFSKLSIETLVQGVIYVQSNNKDTSQWRRSGVFIVNFERISHFITLSR